MKTFIFGFVFGLAVATVGFDGVARMIDKGISTVKETSESLAE